MTITVIIPTLNEASTIAATIGHTATLGFDEIVVVDGGSSDRTVAIVESFVSRTDPSAFTTVRLLIAPPGRGCHVFVRGDGQRKLLARANEPAIKR